MLAALDRDELTAMAAAITTVASLADWDADGAGDPWFGAGIRTAEEAAGARERVEPARRGRGRRHRPHPRRRVPRHPAAGGTDDEGLGSRPATVGDVRDTLEVFRPEVFDIPLDDLVTATGSSAYRRSVGSDLGWLDRWRLRRQARALLRPGRPPADLHVALAERERAAGGLAPARRLRRPTRDPGRARPGPGRPTPRLVADLEWLDQRLPGAEPAAEGTSADAVTSLVDLDLASLRGRVDALAAAAGRLAVVPAVHHRTGRAHGIRAATAGRRPARARRCRPSRRPRRSSGSGGPRSRRRSRCATRGSRRTTAGR